MDRHRWKGPWMLGSRHRGPHAWMGGRQKVQNLGLHLCFSFGVRLGLPSSRARPLGALPQPLGRVRLAGVEI